MQSTHECSFRAGNRLRSCYDARSAINGSELAGAPWASALRRSYRAKSTFGATFASGGASNNLYSLNPNTFAVTLAGNCRRDVL